MNYHLRGSIRELPRKCNTICELPFVNYRGSAIPSASYRDGDLPSVSYCGSALPSVSYRGTALPSVSKRGSALSQFSCVMESVPRETAVSHFYQCIHVFKKLYRTNPKYSQSTQQESTSIILPYVLPPIVPHLSQQTRLTSFIMNTGEQQPHSKNEKNVPGIRIQTRHRLL